MWTLKFKLPDDAKMEDEYPVNIYYKCGDTFTNAENDNEGQLMQAYVFIKGIVQGGINLHCNHDFSNNAHYCRNGCGTESPDYIPCFEAGHTATRLITLL